ncbi:MAG: DNA primase small subunit domain-containing protein [Candidatus Bathycorpusculaceae bacterium]
MSVSSEFVKRKFEEYYREDYAAVHAPTGIEKREFGFLTFDGKTMLRHISFKTRESLESFLRREAYSDAYYSCAYYENVEAEMDRKGWLGADLIFDIDADHIPTSCNKIHDEWVCGACRFTGKGIVPESCPVCGSRKFDVNTWPCETCLNSAKAETIKLLDMLMQDFGFYEGEIHVFFSGHRGYHIHVENEAYTSLDAVARKEIVDYITGLGLDMSFHGVNEENLKKGVFSLRSSKADVGWRRRIATGMGDFILKASEEDFRDIGLKRRVIEAILKSREVPTEVLKGSAMASVVKGVGVETWRKIAEHVSRSLSAKIDTVVTTDVHRLIRLADTLHGKTGLKKVEFHVSEIESFDPFKHAVAFKKGTAKVFVSDAPEFRLGDEIFGPYKNQRVELPTAAAILLVCKGRAEVEN